MRSTQLSIAFLLAVAFMMPGCSTVNTNHPRTVHDTHPGPPAHAPAHGYRRKHQNDNVEMVWDSRKGVYVVIGHSGHYFSNDLYYRVGGEHWEISSGINGPWRVTDYSKIPPGLQKQKKGKGHGKGKGNSKGKGHGKKY